MRIHCLENVDKSLTFLNEMRVHLENMGAHDIVDGNPRLTLGLIWTIILRFQVPYVKLVKTNFIVQQCNLLAKYVLVVQLCLQLCSVL